MLIVVGGLLAPLPAHAIDEVAARKAFERATAAFEHKAWDEAIKQYMMCYKLTSDPTLLYNIAQSHKMAGHASQALQYFKMYLVNVPDASDKKEVEKTIAELQGRLDKENPMSKSKAEPKPEVARKPPPTPAPTPAPAPTPTPAPEPKQKVATTKPKPEEKKPEVKRDPDGARHHYEIATSYLEHKLYEQAAHEFKAAYLANPDAMLLYNIAQAYRLAKQPNEALQYYKMYLAAAPDATDRAEVQRQMSDMEKLAADQRNPPPAPAPAPLPREDNLTETPVAHTETQVATSPGRTKVIAGAVVLVVGLGLVGGGIGCGVLAHSAAQDVSNDSKNGVPFDPSKESSGQTDQTIAGALYGVGAAAAVTGIIVLAIGANENAKAKKMAFTPTIGPKMAGGNLAVRW
jgi:tetratricopeptide (TPR) repeat protein